LCSSLFFIIKTGRSWTNFYPRIYLLS
jgi:hypothetical protein